MKRIIYIGIAGAAIMLSSCLGPQPEEILLPLTDIALTVKGDIQASFNPVTDQIGYNSERNEFRMTDDKIANWVILQCSATPTTEGQELTANLEYTTQNDVIKLNSLTFTVEKTSPEGLVWLWNKEKSIGIVIKLI